MLPDRTLITERILPLDYLDQPERLCVQAQVSFDHLDICKPRWSNGRPPRIYTWSREAIAVWLRWVPQQNSIPLTTSSAWSTQLASEVAAMQAAMTVELGGEATEAIYYTCGMPHHWSMEILFTRIWWYLQIGATMLLASADNII